MKNVYNVIFHILLTSRPTYQLILILRKALLPKTTKILLVGRGRILKVSVQSQGESPTERERGGVGYMKMCGGL